MWNKAVVISVALAFLAMEMSAQQIGYSFQQDLGLFTGNPSLTGNEGHMRFGANYQSYDFGVQDPVKTMSAFFEVPIYSDRVGLGVCLVRDELFNLRQSSLCLSFAYGFELKLFKSTRDRLSIGVMGEYNNYHFQSPDLIINHQQDPLLFSAEDRNNQGNASVGLFYISNYDNEFKPALFFGLAAHQLIPIPLEFGQNSKSGDLRRQIHANGLIGGRFASGELKLKPSLFVQYSYPNIIDVQFQFSMEHKWLFLGAAFNSRGQLLFNYGITLADGWLQDGQLYLAAAHALSVSQISKSPLGGYELNIGYRFEIQ